MLTPPVIAQSSPNPTIDVTCGLQQANDGSLDTIDHSPSYKLDTNDPTSGSAAWLTCNVENENNYEIEVEVEHSWDLLGSIPQDSPVTIAANDFHTISAELTSDRYEKPGTFTFTYSATVTEYLGMSCDDCETIEDSVSVEVVKWTSYYRGSRDEMDNYHSRETVQPDIFPDYSHGKIIFKPCSNQLEFEYFWPFRLDGNVDAIEVTFKQDPYVSHRTESGDEATPQSEIIADNNMVMTLPPGNHNISKKFILDYKKTDANVTFHYSYFVYQVDDDDRGKWDIEWYGREMAVCYIDAEQGKEMEENSEELPGFESSIILLATIFAVMVQSRKQTTDISFP
ncbi:MAG: hypothetical protein ACKVHH_08250 [Candidatus Poseidoniales archaeon]